jgi:hypothetical protein
MSTESGHWYDQDANAFHTIVGKNGKERNTTLADAKRLHLFPSVSGILGVLGKDSLSDWKHRQITEAAFMTQPKPGEFPAAYHTRIIEAAFKQVGDAAERGTRIHKAIEQHFQGEAYDYDLAVYVEAVDCWLQTHGVELIRQEVRCCNIGEGFAGTTDAEIIAMGVRGILDFKTRKTKRGKAVEPYETQVMQIAAYANTVLPLDGVGVNVYISVTEPGRIDATWYSREEVAEAWEMFKHCAALWRYMKGYDPRISPQSQDKPQGVPPLSEIAKTPVFHPLSQH